MTDELCVCGHTRDEHSETGECQVQVEADLAHPDGYCGCGAYEEED